jgi:hypothetical protein
MAEHAAGRHEDRVELRRRIQLPGSLERRHPVRDAHLIHQAEHLRRRVLRHCGSPRKRNEYRNSNNPAPTMTSK